MIKAIWFVSRPADLDPYAFSQHWFERHGPYCLTAPGMRRYMQHHTHAAAAAVGAPVTHDGCSTVEFDSVEAFYSAETSPPWQRLSLDANQGVFGGRPLFARPLQFAIGAEQVIVDGLTRPSMIKAILLLGRPGGTGWAGRAALASSLPSLRRYTQIHRVETGDARITHDGWEEYWFDDLPDILGIAEAPDWRELVGTSQGFVLARERPMLRGGA
ncbi:EthD family reductase [Sphingomonas sp. MMS24-J13]|uniref:EthD family reductase n=1 Tax=Sphingomonas sp. MMS24-J13 TaxID=3238686 RepID=UPI00384DB5A3